MLHDDHRLAADIVMQGLDEAIAIFKRRLTAAVEAGTILFPFSDRILRRDFNDKPLVSYTFNYATSGNIKIDEIGMTIYGGDEQLIKLLDTLLSGQLLPAKMPFHATGHVYAVAVAGPEIETYRAMLESHRRIR